MSFDATLMTRSNGTCELCAATDALAPWLVSPRTGTSADDFALICSTCRELLEGDPLQNANHWRCLNEAMWSEVDAVKVLSYRLLHQLSSEDWSAALVDMMYLDDDALAWAKEGVVDPDAPQHVDSNGAVLNHGDSVVLIKDLNVKGANFTAKRGTAVRNIRLVHDNPEQIEGKINGQSIVILTQYVKK